MEKIKFKVSTWLKSEELMKKVSSIFNIPIEERDADLILENQNFSLRYHPDDREFGFIFCKIYNVTIRNKLNSILSEYQE
ncbi:MAG: hypothetical protein HeimC3_05010 [Candidatus Heimdallarchaeota archaeon LC_3]|nr:MAG: hypothetical protein HeimC3_05010 [Candidatus Heimdallarchaeota archaeon LC_3]